MRKIFSYIIAISICFGFALTAHADFTGNISAKSAILYCADTGDVLYEKNADDKRLIASVTKMMTAIVVIESCDLDEIIKPKPEWCNVEGSSMYLDCNKNYTVREVLTGMMLVSGNDAAKTLACYLSGDERSFSVKMNEKAAELGLKNTSFRNPHGLDDAEHYSTARDLAVLAAYCMQNEDFRAVVSSYEATIQGQTYYNHNRLLVNYKGCVGIKTGYTVKAGRTLVSCAERDGLRLICVTLDDPDDWNDHTALFDYGFSNYSLNAYSTNNFKVRIPVSSAVTKQAECVPQNDVKILSTKADEVSVKLDVPKILFAGGLKGEKVGSIRVFVNGELASQENLVYTENIVQDNSNHLTALEQMQRVIDSTTKPFYLKDKDERATAKNNS